MSFARLLPLLLLVPALSFADADKNFKVAPNQFKTGSVVDPIANMAVEMKGPSLVSQKPVFPLKSNTLYWRHKKGPKEYQWIQGQLNFNNFKKLHAFSLAEAHLNSFEVAQMRFYASQNKKAFQDEDDLYFDKYFIYSPRVPKLLFIKNGKWQILNETALPGVVVFKGNAQNMESAFAASPLKKLPRAIYPLKEGSYVFEFSAPGYLPMVDIGTVKGGEILLMQPKLMKLKESQGEKGVDLSMGVSDVKATKNLEETEILYDKFISELQKVVDLLDTNEFAKGYPEVKPAVAVGLYEGDATYEDYRSAYDGMRLRAKEDWRNSHMKGVSEINAAFKKKLDSLQALPLRGSMAPVSFTPVRERVVEGEGVDSASAPMKEVQFKFGQDGQRFDVMWKGTAKGMNADSLYSLFQNHASEVKVFISLKQNKPVWIRKDGVITGRHHYRYTRIEFEYQGQSLVGLGDFILPGYIVDEPEVQEWLNQYDADDIALQQKSAAEAKAKAAAQPKNDTVYAKDVDMPTFTKMSIPRIIRDNTYGAVALIDSGAFRYKGRVVQMSPFAIMTTEMSQQLFDQIMLREQDTTKHIKNRSTYKNPAKPVHNITWNDARATCKLLGGDLPTEAQWEFAGRADNNEGAIWVMDEDADVGDYAVYRENSYKKGKKSEGYGPQPVGSKKPNAWGIYDMSGNVAEWTRDKYFMFSFWVESSNPTGALMGSTKVYKGGSWKDKEAMQNLTESDDEDPRYWSDAIGFRCVFPKKLFEGR